MESIVLTISLLIPLLIAMPITLIVLFVTSRDKHRQLQQQIDQLRDQMNDLEPSATAEEPPPTSADIQAEAQQRSTLVNLQQTEDAGGKAARTQTRATLAEMDPVGLVDTCGLDRRAHGNSPLPGNKPGLVVKYASTI